ncbi:MAG: glutathione S-transferase N-terminal domain-containing protein [Pseudomonadota bacterium]
MAVMTKKRIVMTLYSGSKDIESHRVRIVLAEKGILSDVIEIGRHNIVEDLSRLNPYNSVPTLVDRDLVLYNSNIIVEYLDERFPHPPLLPVYPVMRAKYRLMMYRVERDWCSLIPDIENKTEKTAVAKAELIDGLTSIADTFADFPYFLSEEFSLVDCYVAPILWRLPKWGIVLPKAAAPLLKYADRLFTRDAFQLSLTETERELRMTEQR